MRKSLLAQTSCPVIIYSICFSQGQFTPSLLLGRSKPSLPYPSFHLQPFSPPIPPVALAGAHPSPATLTVVALGLGGLAFPLLPVLLPLFISDFSFCSLTRKNKYRQCQTCYQSTQKYCPHTSHRHMKQNKVSRRVGSPISMPLSRVGPRF